jgi:Mg2+-importing ATPase
MLVFGLISSVFDYLTFGVLFWLQATVAQFRTGWFIESIVSAALIVLVVRSRRPFFKSRPSKLLLLATVAIVLVAAATPYLPFASVLGFQPMPAYFYLVLGLIVLGYVVTAEVAKSLFYRHDRGAQTGRNL